MLFQPIQPRWSLRNRVTKVITNQNKSMAAELLYPPTTQNNSFMYNMQATNYQGRVDQTEVCTCQTNF